MSETPNADIASLSFEQAAAELERGAHVVGVRGPARFVRAHARRRRRPRGGARAEPLDGARHAGRLGASQGAAGCVRARG